MARIIPIEASAPPDGLATLARELAQGALLAIPTETLYGLAADCRHAGALQRLAALKGREASKPFPLILSQVQEADLLAREISPAARVLMARHWPGPLTLVLQARPGLHPRLLSKDGGLAVRVSSHPVAAALAAALGHAITATSANLSGQPPVSRAQDLDPALLAGLDYVLDAGPCPGGPPSTIADARQEPPAVLRQGAIRL